MGYSGTKIIKILITRIKISSFFLVLTIKKCFSNTKADFYTIYHTLFSYAKCDRCPSPIWQIPVPKNFLVVAIGKTLL